MKKLTSKKVRDYMSYRMPDEIFFCPKAIAAACNDMANEYADTDFARAAEPLEYMRLFRKRLNQNEKLIRNIERYDEKKKKLMCEVKGVKVYGVWYE